MKKTQSFIDTNAKWQKLGDYLLRIDSYRDTSPGLVIENCKSLIESIFKTILVEVSSETEDSLKNTDIGSLYAETKDILFFEKQGYRNIIGSFSKAISEYRNKLGETSHGKDIYTLENNKDVLLNDEVSFLLSTTDSIAFFLLSYYTNLYPMYAAKRKYLRYEDNNEFNAWFDEVEELVNIGGVTLFPSKVLFDGDIEAYKVNLNEYFEVNNLIEKLRICPNFASTHFLIDQLSKRQDYSKEQVKKIFEAFLSNNQVSWIAKDPDVENFYRPLIQEYEELLTEEEISLFGESYNNTI